MCEKRKRVLLYFSGSGVERSILPVDRKTPLAFDASARRGGRSRSFRQAITPASYKGDKRYKSLSPNVVEARYHNASRPETCLKFLCLSASSQQRRRLHGQLSSERCVPCLSAVRECIAVATKSRSRIYLSSCQSCLCCLCWCAASGGGNYLALSKVIPLLCYLPGYLFFGAR